MEPQVSLLLLSGPRAHNDSVVVAVCVVLCVDFENNDDIDNGIHHMDMSYTLTHNLTKSSPRNVTNTKQVLQTLELLESAAYMARLAPKNLPTQKAPTSPIHHLECISSPTKRSIRISPPHPSLPRDYPADFDVLRAYGGVFEHTTSTQTYSR